MQSVFSQEVREIIDPVLEAEKLVSVGSCKPYNNYVDDTDNTTAVSASGRVMRGSDEVRAATVAVSQGSVGEENRVMEYIACDQGEDMLYALVKTSVDIKKDDGTVQSLCWVITLVMKKRQGKWRLVHRQNTRSDPQKG